MSSPHDLSSESSAPVRATANWREAFPRAAPRSIYDMEPQWMRLFAWSFLLFGAFYFLIYARDSESPQALLFTTLKAMAMIALSQSVLIYLFIRAFNYVDIGPGIGRVRTKVPDDEAVPVSLIIRQKGAVTGYDEGFLWFSEGSLFYKGFQTAFRLNRDDIPPLSMWDRKDLPKPSIGRGPRRIPVPVSDRDMTVQYKIIDPFEDHENRRKAARFSNAMDRWLSESQESALESLLPPIGLHAYLPTTRSYRVHPMLVAAAMASIDLIVAFAPPLPSSIGSMPEAARFLLMAVCLALALASLWMANRFRTDLEIRRQIYLKSQIEKIP